MRMLTTAQAAARLGYASKTLRNQLSLGRLDHLRGVKPTGGTWRFPEAAVEAAARTGRGRARLMKIVRRTA